MDTISVEQLTLKRRDGFRLGPMNLRLAAGERVALIGPSGCGKTTFLRLLAGLEKPASGTIRFGEQIVSDARRLLPPGERGIGFVFQDGALWPHLTARKQLEFADPGLSAQKLASLFARVGLAGLEERRPDKLSGGEQQRLALARALVGDPTFLMLDEPLHSVDVHLRDSLSLLIRRIAEERGLGLILVTHDRQEALAMADRLVVLKEGRIVEEGTAAHLLAHPGTAYGAAFLCGAACFDAEPQDSGEGREQLATVFGLMPRPGGRGEMPLSLVVLPGDVRISSNPREETPRGLVLQCFPSASGSQANVDLEGKLIRVPCESGVAPGAMVPLELCGEPRFLPWDVAVEEGQP